MKKLVIFVHFQLYVKQNQSYLRLDPPLEKFSGSAPEVNNELLNWGFPLGFKKKNRKDGGGIIKKKTKRNLCASQQHR